MREVRRGAGRTDQLSSQLEPEPSCRRSRGLAVPPVMFVDSFDESSGSCDGRPQPLAEESIAKTSSRLELIIIAL